MPRCRTAGELSLADLLLLLEREPACAPSMPMSGRNLSAVGRHALIRCDGGGKFGYGHVKRMVALARALRDCEGFGVVIGFHGDDEVAGLIRPRRSRRPTEDTADPGAFGNRKIFPLLFWTGRLAAGRKYRAW